MGNIVKLAAILVKLSAHSESRLKDLCTIKTNFEDADFWLIRKGTENSVGKPTETYNSEFIGIKVNEGVDLLPKYLYYMMAHIHNSGYFARLSRGSLRLKHISTDDVKSIKVG